MSSLSNYICENIYDVVYKNYEHRNTTEHNLLNQMLQNFYPTLTSKAIKLLSFYVTVLQGPQIITSKQYNSQSFIFTGVDSENPQQVNTMHNITKQSKINLKQNQKALFLDYQHYVNCMVLGQTSIQEEINFMQSSQYLCSIPKKRLYFLLRNSKILSYSMSQCIYYEGQKIQSGQSGSGVYFVRKGDFGYYKNIAKQNKQVETLRFTKGHIIGTLQLIQGINNIQKNSMRVFTVKCKTSKSIVYNFSEEIFISHIKPYCEQYLIQRQSKLMKYIDGHIKRADQIRGEKNSLLSQNLTRRFSLGDNMTKSKNSDLPILTRTKMSIPHYNQTVRTSHSQQLQQQGLRKTANFSAFKDGPLKRYPLATQRSTFTDSEFKDFVKLERSKDQCQKIRKLKGYTSSVNRGQILFSFFKNTWMFEKEKQKFRRYQ